MNQITQSISKLYNYKGSVIIFDDILGARNTSQIDEFFTRRRHENLDVYYISQSYFGLPRQSITNNSDRIMLFKQTLRDVESLHKDIGGYKMNMINSKKSVVKLGVENLIISVLI